MDKLKFFLLSVFITTLFAGLAFFLLIKNNDPVKVALSKIHANQQVQKEATHYRVNSTDVFAKEISSNLLVTVENYKEGGSLYSFYSNLNNPVKLITVESFLAPKTQQEAFEALFFEKDITGDGVKECFIKLQTTGNSLSGYAALRLVKNSLVRIRGESSSIIEFDEINYENGKITTLVHDVDFRGKAFYRLEGDKLILIKTIGFFLVPNIEGIYEVRERTAGNDYKVIERKKGNIWTDDFDQYENF